jgi:hypothetical protein
VTVAWVERPDLAPWAPPDPDFPYGISVNIAGSLISTCELPLPYPAPGVGEWVLVCDACGFTTTITAAGQADDPTKIRVPCNR